MRALNNVSLKVFVSCALMLPAAAQAQVPVTSEFRVNEWTTAVQHAPAAASDATGQFVIAWASRFQDGDGFGIFARRFAPSGIPLGVTEFRVNAYTTADQQAPDIALEPGGRMVVVWEGWDQDGSLAGVFGRRYEADGTPGPEFQVNTYTTGMQREPAVAMNASGSFVVTWAGNAGTDVEAIRARRYDASGVPGPEFTVASHASIEMRPPDVALDDDGKAVFVWSTDSGSIFGSRYDAAGAIDVPPFQVNTYISGTQIAPRVALDAHGGFVVVWNGARPAPDVVGVTGRRYDALGQPVGGEFVVNSHTTGVQNNPALARGPNGNFLAAWADDARDGSAHGVYARPFDRVAAPSDNDFRANVHTTEVQWMSAVAPIGDRRFVVTWASNLQDGSNHGVYARIFETDLIFRDGFESGDMSEWSSSQTDGSDLDVTALAALNASAAGLQGTVDDTAGLYVQDDTPNDETEYHARFYFDTGDFDPGESLNKRRTRLFLAFEEAPTRRVIAIVLRRLNGDYSLMGRARLDDNSQHDTGFKPISPGTHFVEVHWQRASAPGVNDGVLEMWIDGLFAHTNWNLVNNLSAVDFVRLGALSVKSGANGTLAWDAFESRRHDYIGP